MNENNNYLGQERERGRERVKILYYVHLIILCISTILYYIIKHNNILYCIERLIFVDEHPRMIFNII